ncbi:MAG TPA: glycosyltransferase [Candidatus Acidoferrales bacterium]|nr:glycosyltransferase [Candidatus Acidoferrales bacterium]
MPIRIMHVVDTWAVGGLQNGVANLIERMDPDRFEHVVCAMRPVEGSNAQRIPVGRTRVVSLSTKESLARFQLPALARWIRDVKPDIVHTRNWGTFEALLAARRIGGCARVHSEHGIDWDTTAKEPWRRLLCRRLAFQLADRVLSVSLQLRDLHARRTGFPANRIEVIHNGVDSRRFCPDAAARIRIRRELRIADDELCIGCVGNLIPVKDHLTLLRAVDGLARRGRSWRLLIAGDGPERPRLAAFVDAHPAWKGRVTFLGRHNAVASLLNAMDVYVLSSLTEGISNSLLEAMATGLPVLATETGGNPEVVTGGESGLLFPVGDEARLTEHLVALGTRPEWRLEMGRRALRRVREEFSIDAMVRKYEEIYESLAMPAAVPIRAVARV